MNKYTTQSLFFQNMHNSMSVVCVFDIGSGATKALVMDTSTWKHLWAEERELMLKADVMSNDGVLSDGAIEQLVQVMQSFVDKAKTFNATRFMGVATAAFRDARNGPEVISMMVRSRFSHQHVELRIVTQQEEGRLGFFTALGCASPVDKNQLLSFDSGGGSFQLAYSNGEQIEVFEGPWGSVSATHALVTKVQGRPLGAGLDAQMICLHHCEMLEKILRSSIASCNGVEKVRAKTRQSTGVRFVGIGGPTSMFQMMHLANTQFAELLGLHRCRNFGVSFARELIECLVHDWSTRSALFPQPEVLLGKLVLFCSIMEELFPPAATIEYHFTIGSCVGILQQHMLEML